MEDVKIIVTIVVSLTGGIWGAYKIIRKPMKSWIKKRVYMNGIGYHLLESLEKEFGKDAGMVIKALLQQQGRQHSQTDLRLQKIELISGLGIYVCEPDGRCTFVNPALADMFDMDRNDMLGFGWVKNIVDKPRAIENWKFSVNAAIPYTDTYEIIRAGKVVKCYTEATPIIEHNILMGYVGIVREVSDETV